MPSNNEALAVSRRTGHVSVQHRGQILVWGGYTQEEDGQHPYWPADLLHVHRSGIWTTRTTRGDHPPKTCGATAQAVDDELFILCGFAKVDGGEDDTNDVYALNLNTWQWRKLEPSGTHPLRCDKLTSWVQSNRIFIFGGFGPSRLASEGLLPTDVAYEPDVGSYRGWSNQLAAYDTKENAWHWPRCSGHVPSPRAAHSAIASGSRVFIFGGRLQKRRMNDLYVLDMDTMRWEQLEVSGVWPRGRSWHTMTLVSPTSGLLYGGYDKKGRPLSDCWLLHLEQRRWTRCTHLESGGCRLWHQAVTEEQSGQVWIIGGVINDLLGHQEQVLHPENVLKLTVTPVPLLLLAADTVVKEKQRLMSQLPDLPRTLQTLVKSRLSIE